MGDTPVIDKKRRYDRQLRIWGEAGQAQLESAHVCLLTCGPTGTEALKNLVLGGIAAFTLVDGAKVTPADLGNNFLVDATALGSSRAACVAALLKELNDSVAGSFVEEDPEQLVASNPTFFKNFSLVIATQLREDVLLALDVACREHNVPLLAARSYGLVGCMRISVAEHTVIESKPENAPDDLRLSAPWPELEQHCASVDLTSCDDLTHKHVPYVVLLVQALRSWRREHAGAVPASSAERAAFKELVRSMARSHDQENVREALAAAHKAWAPVTVPPDVHALLDDPAVTEAASAPSSNTPDFWLLCAALKAFVAGEGHGALPLNGAIPDMTSTTDAYIVLQRLYAERAQADAAAVEAHLDNLLCSSGRSAGAIPRDSVRLFCKNSAHLHMLRYLAMAHELASPGDAATTSCAATSATSSRGAMLARACAAEDAQRSNAMLYLILRAVDRCAAQLGRWPGTLDGALEEDVPRLKAATASVLAEYGPALSGLSVPDDLVSEMCRFGAAELHCVAAVMGGLASQEAIKLITHQFVPLPTPLMYNAMDSTTTLLALA